MGSNKCIRYIVLTGRPGVGKTTMIKNVCSLLKSKNYNLKGFYTEEVRQGSERIGFDVISLDGERSVLARKNSPSLKGPMVGTYNVDVQSFESTCLKIFNFANKDTIIVLDEIGKMEAYSKEFLAQVSRCFQNDNLVIFATIPIMKGKSIPLVEMIRNHPRALIITIDRSNKPEEIAEYIIQAKFEVTAARN